MYARGGVLGAGASASLPFTGTNLFWLVLAGFTLLAAGLALLRVLPSWRPR
jgi:hypothetical protein